MSAAHLDQPDCCPEVPSDDSPLTAQSDESSRAVILPAEPAPSLLAFFERFLDEQSIKWMLGLGMLTLLASSLKFVTDHWESYSPFWKYLVLIAYTAAMYGGAEISLHRLALKRTGTGLLALTLALLPMTFLALRWLAPGLPTDFYSLLHDAGLAGLMIINIGFTAFASRRIWRTLLREVPTTYWLSYLTLCVAGALLPAIPTAFAPIAAFALWAVFTAGVVKVNRHVFWLAEEERWPRIFSFFPTVLLSAQFLTVFALNLASSISTPWLGFGLVLVAAPVLLTADAVAAVFQQRTGKIVFPWPAEIVLPLVLGLGCCAAGMGLALTDLPRPVAFVPTALLAAVCVGAVARRTGHQAFAWGMLFCLLGAYQFSPVYFLDLARQVVHQSAVAVHESRLPFAFYGITYAPFILALLVAKRGLKSPTFAVPCRQLSVVLCSVMLAASWTHPKAVFIAGITLTALWTLLRFGYGNRHLTWGAGLSFLSAAFGLETFLRDVCLVPVSADFTFYSVAGAAAVLWSLDRAVRSVIHRTGHPTDFAVTLRGGPPFVSPLEFMSAASAVFLAAGWFVQFGMSVTTLGTGSITAILLLLAVHQRQRSYPVLGELVLALAGWTAVRYGLAAGITWINLELTAAVLLATAWAVARALEPFNHRLTISGFRLPMLRVTTAVLVLLQIDMLGVLLRSQFGWMPAAVLLTAGVTTLWSFLAAGRTLPVLWVHVACASLMGAVPKLVPVVTVEWLPVAWATTAILVGVVARRIAHRTTDAVNGAVADEANRFAKVIEFALMFGTLWWLTTPARVAGVMACVAIAARVRNDSTSLLRHAVVEAGFLQLLAGLLSVMTNAANLDDVSCQTWRMVQLPGTVLIAAWVMSLQTNTLRRWLPNRELADAQSWLWRIAVIGSLGLVLFVQRAPLSGLTTAALAGSFALLVAEQFRLAARKQDVESVWCGLGLIAAAIGYLAWFDVFDPRHAVPLGIGIAAGMLLSVIGHTCRRSISTVVFAEPFELIGYWLPAAMAVVAVIENVREAASVWTGAYSFIVFAAAACYFIRWIERRDPTSLVIATLIFNVSQMLLWHDLQWSDPQLYLMPLGLSFIGLVEGLPRELPAEGKTTLRYAGALTILVSPLFHILDGSWLPLLTLMAASLLVSLLAIGLRSRPLLYSGTAFLVADLVAMVIRGGLDRADVLWVAGIGLGTAVVVLAAYCENHREVVLQRMRLLAATLQTWE